MKKHCYTGKNFNPNSILSYYIIIDLNVERALQLPLSLKEEERKCYIYMK